MSAIVSFTDVSTTGLQSSPVAEALAGLRANEARDFKNKDDHVFSVDPASEEYGCGHTHALGVLSIAAPTSQSPYKSRTVMCGGIAMTTTKTRRLELRTDAATDQLISEAADLLHVTKSAFVADAARQAAEKIIARSDVTLMSPVVFDTMMASLDVPDESPELAELAKLPRLITQ